MKIQTLVATIGQNDRGLPEKMNIRTDAIIGNQCGVEEVTEFECNGHRVQYVNTALRGVGINRNEILMRATGDVVILADDDMVFLPGYEETARSWFEKLPRADVLIFNLEGGAKRYRHSRVTRIHSLNYGKYGAARLAFRREKVQRGGILFHTMFGGGSRYSCGEDTIFLRDCLRKGLKIYGIPASLAQIEDGNSTWFRGYTDQYFFDKGVLYWTLNRYLCRLHVWVHCFRHREQYAAYGRRKAIKQMMKGIDAVK